MAIDEQSDLMNFKDQVNKFFKDNASKPKEPPRKPSAAPKFVVTDRPDQMPTSPECEGDCEHCDCYHELERPSKQLKEQLAGMEGLSDRDKMIHFYLQSVVMDNIGGQFSKILPPDFRAGFQSRLSDILSKAEEKLITSLNTNTDPESPFDIPEVMDAELSRRLSDPNFRALHIVLGEAYANTMSLVEHESPLPAEPFKDVFIHIYGTAEKEISKRLK